MPKVTKERFVFGYEGARQRILPMSEPKPMTYAAAQAILKAPRFADPDAIAARDLIAAVERVVELAGDARDCLHCVKGKAWNYRDRCNDECRYCDGLGFVDDEPNGLGHEELLELWRNLPPDARQEALRRARTQRQGQAGGRVPPGKAVRP